MAKASIKQRYPDLDADLWMFSSSDCEQKRLVGVNCNRLTKVHAIQMPAKLADYPSFQVMASVKEQGLLCLLAQDLQRSNKTIFLGNPFTQAWDDVPCPPHEGTLIGVGASATSVYHANSVKLCCFFQKETGCSVCIYDTQSKTWKEGATCSQVQGKTWQCTPDCGSTMVYIWRKCTDNWISFQMMAFAYDMASDEWEQVINCSQEKVDISGGCIHGQNYPTLILCRGVPYWIGRDNDHKFVKVYGFDKTAGRFGLLADFPWNCKNTTIKYASDGNDSIYVIRRWILLKYQVSSRKWQIYQIPCGRDRFGLDQALYPYPQCLVFTKAVDWELLVPCKIPRLRMGQSIWLLNGMSQMYDRQEFAIAVNIRDNDVLTLKNGPPDSETGLKWFGASLPELNLVCVLQAFKSDSYTTTLNFFPEKIHVGNPFASGPWEELVLFDMSGIDPEAAGEDVMSCDGWETRDPDRLRHEFIGVAMQTGSRSGSYMLYYFHKVDTSILVKVYDSVTRSWREGAPFVFENWGQNVPDDDDNRWRKLILPSDWQVACTKQKVYVYSSVYCRMEQSNMLRVLFYSWHTDAWEVVKWMRFPDVMQECRQFGDPSNVLVSIQGELFVVSRPVFPVDYRDCPMHGSFVDIRRVGRETLELVAQLNVTGKYHVAGDSDGSRIFMAVWEDKRNHPLRKTRLMVYDLEAGEWSEFPVQLPDFKSKSMIML